MKFFFVFVALFACIAAYEVELLTEDQWSEFVQDETVAPETQGLILNSQAKKAVKDIVKQMPCGWPELGIPPVAPYTNAELELHLAKSAVDSLIQLLRFRLDGLDNLQIKKLKVSYTLSKKVKYHFIFKELKAQAATLNTDTFIDMMRELGLTVRYEGTGPMEFALENLSFKGQFKYKMPFLFGSIKIYKFECIVGLGGVRSNIGGILGNGKINELINDEIENMIPAYINGNQAKISAQIEEAFVPRVNAMMKGKKFWSLIGSFGGPSSKCKPTPAPWLAEI